MSKIRYHIVVNGTGLLDIEAQRAQPKELPPDRKIMGQLIGPFNPTDGGAYWRVQASTVQLRENGERTKFVAFVVADQRLDDILPVLTGRWIQIAGDGSVWCADGSSGRYVRVVSVNEALDLVTARAIDYPTAWAALSAPGAPGREAAMARVVDAMKRQPRAE
jgi:hypothetical protein